VDDATSGADCDVARAFTVGGAGCDVFGLLVRRLLSRAGQWTNFVDQGTFTNPTHGSLGWGCYKKSEDLEVDGCSDVTSVRHPHHVGRIVDRKYRARTLMSKIRPVNAGTQNGSLLQRFSLCQVASRTWLDVLAWMPSMELASLTIYFISTQRPATRATPARAVSSGICQWQVDQPERSGWRGTLPGEFIEY